MTNRTRATWTRASALSLSLVMVGVAVLAVLPFSDIALGARPSFVPAMLAIIGALDLLSAVLLTRQFSDTGDRRALALATSYVFSLVVLAGYGAAFPGVLAQAAPLGGWPSAAPWLYMIWHTGFPVLLAAAVAPWPRRWTEPTPAGHRRTAVWATVTGSVAVGAAMVWLAVTGQGRLPVLIDGLDTSAMTRITGPVALPLAAVATVVAVVGALRLTGPPRWAALAAVVALADLVLTLFSYHRFSLGWYAGRSLTVVSSAVVLVALLAEFSRLKRRLGEEAERLRALLQRTEELEGQHSSLLNHMADGVMLQNQEGRVVCANPAVSSLLGLSMEQLEGRSPIPDGWAVLAPDGTPCPHEQTPAAITLATGEPQRDRIIGVGESGGPIRWLRMNTSVERGGERGDTRYVMSSMTDETERHEAHVAATAARHEKHVRVRAVMDSGGPQMVVQPIVDLRTGVVVGAEALSRFPLSMAQGADRWFADADEVGLGMELELSAVRAALAEVATLPYPAYLSLNVSPVTATEPALYDLLADSTVPGRRVVLELTEHTGVADYPALHAALTALRQLGIRVAVDDAGSGYASLRHILKLDPDIVKLDIDLVRGIHADPARRALAAGLLTFADQIGACLVAEGIETEKELIALREVGITHGQGYFLGRPSAGPVAASVPVTHAAPCTVAPELSLESA